MQFHNWAQAPNHHEVDCDVGWATSDAGIAARAERNGGKADSLSVRAHKKYFFPLLVAMSPLEICG